MGNSFGERYLQMANGAGGTARTDRFGNPFKLVGCKPDKKNPAFCKGYIEISGKLYKLEPSVAQKEGYSMWVKVTQVQKQARRSF